MRRRLLGLLVLLPACGSILGVQDLDVTEHESTDAGPKVTTPTPDSGQVVTPPPTGFDAGPPLAVLPPDGTYFYTATDESNDTLTVAGQSVPHHYSAPQITVTAQNPTCFTEVVALRSDYTDTLSTYCITGSTLTLQQDQRAQVFNAFANANTTSQCSGLDPDAGLSGPGDVYFTTQPKDGDFWIHTCHGSNSANDTANGGPSDNKSSFTQTGQYQYVETVDVPVAGQMVSTFHFHVDLAISGNQTGTNRTDLYVSPKHGLPVRFVRSIDISYPTGTILGTARYQETVDMTLKSPPP